MAVATTDPETGSRIAAQRNQNPTRNAEFLATQLQSAGYFQLGRRSRRWCSPSILAMPTTSWFR